jgi:DNA-binding response OmpR family regulator
MSDWLLVVDDDEEVRQAYERHFAAAGFEVRSAATLGRATDLLATTSFDAVIADVSLTPDGSEGLAIAAYMQHLRRSRTSSAADAPIVVLTAYGSPERAGAAARLGVDVFLHKPASLVWLESEIRARLGNRRWAGTPGDRHPGINLQQAGLRLLGEGLTR